MSKILAAALIFAFLDTTEAGKAPILQSPFKSAANYPGCCQQSSLQYRNSAGPIRIPQALPTRPAPAQPIPIAPQPQYFNNFPSILSLQPPSFNLNLPPTFGGSLSSTLSDAPDSIVKAPNIAVRGLPGQDISVVGGPTFSAGGSSTLFNAGNAVAIGADVTAIGADGLIGANAFAKGSDAISFGGSTTLGLPGNAASFAGAGTAKGGSGLFGAGNGVGVGGSSFAAPGVASIASNANAINVANMIPGFNALVQSLKSPCGQKC